MNRSLASKAGNKEVKAGSRAAAGSRNRDSRVKSPDRVASTAVSKSRGKADKVASAKLSAPPDDQFSPGLGRGFFSVREPLSRRATLAFVATGYLKDAHYESDAGCALSSTGATAGAVNLRAVDLGKPARDGSCQRVGILAESPNR